MRYTIFFVVVLIFGVQSNAQTNNYDSALANKLHADEYGMKKYVLVILKPGSASFSKDIQDTIFDGHMKNITKLAEEGKLVVAGPLGKNDLNYRGIFIFNSNSIAETTALVETDPAVKNKLLIPEYFIWYGSAAMQQVYPIHKTLQKNSIVN